MKEKDRWTGKMKEIQSTQNPLIKKLKKLKQKKYREQSGSYLLEGTHLVEEAVKADALIKQVFMTESLWQKLAAETWLKKIEEDCVLVSAEVLKQLSSVPAPQGIIALVEMPTEMLPEEIPTPALLLDCVQDPGNVGTMIRTADAAGFKSVILGTGTADIYNEKVLRSMQGSHFHLKIIQEELKLVIEKLKQQQVTVIGTELNPKAKHYKDLPAYENVALLMGNEGQGVQKELLALTDLNTYIPLRGQAESLNVAVAAGILMFHLSK